MALVLHVGSYMGFSTVSRVSRVRVRGRVRARLRLGLGLVLGTCESSISPPKSKRIMTLCMGVQCRRTDCVRGSLCLMRLPFCLSLCSDDRLTYERNDL